MKVRQIIIIAVAVLIVIIGKIGMGALSNKKENKPKPSFENVATVFVDTVELKSIPIFTESTGVLEAINRTELFSEVQGVMKADGGRFKAGNRFSQGQALIRLKADDQQAQLVAERSSFESLLNSIMPDLRIDYAESFAEWDQYLKSMDPQTILPSLPTVKNDKLKAFLTGRNVFSQFYRLKNLELVVAKYVITAPFSGELVESNVDPGTVVRPGQKLGVFVQPGLYELRSSLDVVAMSRLKVGQNVNLHIDGVSDKSWSGKISRINTSVEQESQMSEFFVRVQANDLKEGMFLKAQVQAQEVENAFSLPRSVLQAGDKVFVVEDSILVEQVVTPLHYDQENVVLSGLKTGQLALNKVPPGVFPGMKVKIYRAK